MKEIPEVKLHLGKMTNQELAEWFNTTYKQITNKKKQYLKKLEDYCRFETYRGGIDVKEIYKECYCKNANYQLIRHELPRTWNKNGLDTCSHVNDIIYENHYEKLTVTKDTAYNYTKQARDELFGSPSKGTEGLLGKCSPLICVKDENGNPVYLTEEQEAIKKKLLTKWFGDADEKTVLVQTMVAENEIKEEEAWATYSRLLSLPKKYEGFMDEFHREIKAWPIRGTVIEYIVSPWEIKDGQFDF